ncbi:LPXTG cell wall anchor domain-containing protein, partial [Paucilactobacillus sp. N302-9]
APTTVPATVNPDGTITTTEKVTYTPETHDYSITPVDADGNPVPGSATTPETGKTDVPIDSTTFPTVPGYTPQDGQDVTVPTGDTPVNVVYVPNTIEVPVTYIDQDNDGKIVTTGDYTGVTDESTDNFTPNIPDGFELVTTDKPGTTPAKNGEITVQLKHKHVSGSYVATRTISYDLAQGDHLTPGAALPDTISQTVTYSTDTDEATGVTMYTPEGSYSAESTPELQGYTASRILVDGVYTTVTTSKPEVSDQTVTYTANETTNNVTIPSDKGNQVVTGVTGKTGQTIEVSVPTVPGYTADKTTIPALINANGTITPLGTVNYTPDNHAFTITPVDEDGTPIPNSHSVTVSGYTDAQIPDSDYPTLPGYRAVTNQDKTVPAENSNVTIVYVPIEHAITIVPVDQNGNPIKGLKPITVYGTTGEKITLPAIAGYLPAGSMTIVVPAQNGSVMVEYIPVATQSGSNLGVGTGVSNRNVSANGQSESKKLPQTDERSEDQIAGLGILGLATSLLGFLGLKKRKENEK